MDSWYKDKTVRSITSELENSATIVVNLQKSEVGLLVKPFHTSFNLIPKSGYDTIKGVLTDDFIDTLQSVKLEIKEYTTALIPFQMPTDYFDSISEGNGYDFIIRNDSFEIPCYESEAVLEKNISRRKRTQLRNVGNTQHTFEIDSTLAYQKFPSLYQDTAKYLGTPDKKIMSINQISRLLALNKTHLMSVKISGHIELIHMVGLDSSEKNAEFVHSAFRSELGRECAAELIWFTTLSLKQSGVFFFNLGGGIHPGDGLENFKRQMGGIRNKNFGLKTINNQEVYKECITTKFGTAFLPGRFPPYLS